MTLQDLVESSRTSAPVDVKANVARVLLDALARECKAYCILSGYERLPERFDTGIDFMVDQEDFDRMPQIIAEVARKTGTCLFQAIDHERTGRAYFLGSLEGPALTIIQPDCAADYRHFGRRWLQANEVLAARRLHPGGFYIPSVAHEFAYSLINRLNKRSFNREHGYRLHRLYVEDRIECGRMIARFIRGPEGSQIVRMASANDWAAIYSSIEPFRAAMMRSRKDTFAEKLQEFPRQALSFLRRIVQPTGCSIAVMGPDTSGRSLVLNAVSQEFAPSFCMTRFFHLRPRGIGPRADLGPVSDPHGQPPRGAVASVAIVIGLWFSCMFGYLGRLLQGLIRSELVLFDRCFYDLLVDGRRIRYGGPPWLLRAAARLAPGPDLVFLLDAPPEVVRSRNQEVSPEETARQRAIYLELVRTLSSAVVLNVAQLPGEVIHDAIAAVMNYLEGRTKKRLRIPALSASAARQKRQN